jgi:hypothetical protein
MPMHSMQHVCTQEPARLARYCAHHSGLNSTENFYSAISISGAPALQQCRSTAADVELEARTAERKLSYVLEAAECCQECLLRCGLRRLESNARKGESLIYGQYFQWRG